MEGKKFCESTWALDIKILMMAVCCGLGYLSHFYFKFPRDYLQVGLCLAAYCVFMAITFIIDIYVEKGAFFASKSHEVSQDRFIQYTTC